MPTPYRSSVIFQDIRTWRSAWGGSWGSACRRTSDSPYLALNIQDFWRRWHITLSLWLRDYLYIPLGGDRRGNRYLNLIITMALGGLWHGSNIRFLVWGVMHGVGLAVVPCLP